MCFVFRCVGKFTYRERSFVEFERDMIFWTIRHFSISWISFGEIYSDFSVSSRWLMQQPGGKIHRASFYVVAASCFAKNVWRWDSTFSIGMGLERPTLKASIHMTKMPNMSIRSCQTQSEGKPKGAQVAGVLGSEKRVLPMVAKGPKPTRNQITVSIQAGVTHFFWSSVRPETAWRKAWCLLRFSCSSESVGKRVCDRSIER